MSGCYIFRRLLTSKLKPRQSSIVGRVPCSNLLVINNEFIKHAFEWSSKNILAFQKMIIAGARFGCIQSAHLAVRPFVELGENWSQTLRYTQVENKRNSMHRQSASMATSGCVACTSNSPCSCIVPCTRRWTNEIKIRDTFHLIFHKYPIYATSTETVGFRLSKKWPSTLYCCFTGSYLFLLILLRQYFYNITSSMVIIGFLVLYYKPNQFSILRY